MLDNPAASPEAVERAQGRVQRPTPELAAAMARGYEPKDISLRGLFVFLGTLVVTLVVVLFVIYAIMMALVDNDRSRDPLGVPVSITRAEPYAPLQPTFQVHETEDWEDMDIMRAQVQQVLMRPALDRQMKIDDAMQLVVGKLVKSPHPVAEPVQPTYPAGSIEGRYSSGSAVKTGESSE